MDTLLALQYLMGESDSSTEALRALLAKSDFLIQLANFDATGVNAETLLRVEEVISSRELTVDKCGRASIAIANLLTWIKHTIEVARLHMKL